MVRVIKKENSCYDRHVRSDVLKVPSKYYDYNLGKHKIKWLSNILSTVELTPSSYINLE